MPRVRTLGVPEALRELENTIKEQFGNMLSPADVGKLLGLKHQNSYNKWLEDVPGHIVLDRRKYFAFDVAKKLYEDSL